MIQAKFGHFHRLQKRPSADIYKCVTYIRTVPEFVHSINFFFLFLFFQKNTQQDWVTLMKAHNGRFLGNSVNGSKTICIKTGHARIQEFSSGRVQVSLTKKADVFFFVCFLVLSLFYRSQMVNFKEIYHFSRFKVPKRVQHFPGGGSNFFQGGGGSNCLFPI